MYGNPPPDLKDVSFKRVKLQSENGRVLEITLDIYLPDHTAAKEQSESHAILYIHGGAMIAMDSTDMPTFLPRHTKSHNLILISTNYRLAPQASVADAMSDCVDAARWCESDLQRTLDAQASDLSLKWSGKTAVVGGSAGGWLTLLVASVGLKSVKAVAAIYQSWSSPSAAMTNVSDAHFEIPKELPSSASCDLDTVSQYIDGPTVAGATPDVDYTTGEVHGRHRAAYYMARGALWRKWLLDGSKNEAEEQQMHRHDARKLVSKSWPPTFLLHGTEDSTIPPSNSHDMTKAFSQMGVPHELRLVDGEAHFFDMLAPSEEEERLGISQLLTFITRQLQADA